MSEQSEEPQPLERYSLREMLRIAERGTEDEKRRLMDELLNPHSRLVDALEKMSEWIVRANGEDESFLAQSDESLAHAAARSDRRAIVTFIVGARAGHRITEELASQALEAGRLDSPAPEAASRGDIVAATDKMVDHLCAHQPELRDEIDRILRWSDRHRGRG